LVERVLNNTERIENLVVHGTEFVANFASFAVLLTVLLIFSWRLTLITILFSVLIALAVSVYLRFLSNTGRKSANSSREMTSSLYESINGIRVIKSYVKERIQTSMLKDKVEKDRRIHHQLNFGNYMVHIITESLGVISIGVMFLLATIIYDINDNLLIAQLIPFIYILTRIIPTVKILNQARGSIASRLPFLKLLYDLLRSDDKPYIRDGCKSFVGLKGGIRFKSVTFSYTRNKTRALINADYYIPKGKTTAIVGESGAGKSTVVSLLLRFYDPKEGVILIDGEPLETFNIESYRRKIGIVSQDTFLFNDTIKANIAFGAAEKTTDELIIESARKAGAHEFIIELPEGYDTVLGDRGVRLSGGERQRISIARAILKNPDILILDEATSSLDSRTEKLIQNAICELSRNRTVIIIAHRLSTIKGADQIIVLQEGRVVEIGEEAQLIDRKGEYYKLSRAHL
jgi:ABC-type multidrug transport system fused ATPase/permease subunit